MTVSHLSVTARLEITDRILLRNAGQSNAKLSRRRERQQKSNSTKRHGCLKFFTCILIFCRPMSARRVASFRNTKRSNMWLKNGWERHGCERERRSTKRISPLLKFSPLMKNANSSWTERPLLRRRNVVKWFVSLDLLLRTN